MKKRLCHVVCVTLCLHHLLLLASLPWLGVAKPTMDASRDDDIDDDDDDDDKLKDGGQIAAEQTEVKSDDDKDDVPQEIPHQAQAEKHQDDSQAYGAGSVEEMVHGEDEVHGKTPQGDDVKSDDDVNKASGTVDVEHVMHGSHNVHESQENPEQQQQQQQEEQHGPRDVEQIVHGEGDVHMTSLDDEALLSNNDFQREIGTEDTEHLMHGADNVHESLKEVERAILDREFQAGNVEQMVHGEEHVHDGKGRDQGEGQQVQGPYSAGEEETLKFGTVNVHDPKQRAKMDTAGDVLALAGEGGGGGEEESGEGGRGKTPTVMDTEHLMHGQGGHDHDVRSLQDFKPREDKDKSPDSFQNIHHMIMHDDGNPHDHGQADDDQIRRGKTITYKDIMALGLDEEDLKGIDLTKLLLENAREYDDWQRDKQTIKGESPETSFWEQLGELRRRYLSFGRNDGPARDLTGTMLDPSQQKWVSEPERGIGERGEGEDAVLHHLETIGRSGSLKDRHKDRHQEHESQGGENHHTTITNGIQESSS